MDKQTTGIVGMICARRSQISMQQPAGIVFIISPSDEVAPVTDDRGTCLMHGTTRTCPSLSVFCWVLLHVLTTAHGHISIYIYIVDRCGWFDTD